MNLPSVKTLKAITSYPRELRKVLELDCIKAAEAMLEDRDHPVKFPDTNAWVARCYHYPKLHELKMAMADELCETYGVEYIEKGHNQRSPAIEYLNAGDTYTATLLYVRGRYQVGCWGDYVERGNYD